MVESPVRRQAGQIVPIDEMIAITDFCKERDIPTHLDGARLYMMSAATEISPVEYSALFDTVYVSLYKYFGAPYGAILAGDADFIDGIYHDRRMFGGGLASAGFAAALALDGTRGFEERFAQAMSKAGTLFEQLNRISGLAMGRFEHGSNIFPVALEPDVNADKFVSELRDRSIFIRLESSGAEGNTLTVNTTILRRTNEEILEAFQAAISQAR